MSDELLPGETRAEWGARTGRYAPDRIPFWQAQIDGERRVMASAGTGDGPNRVEAAIRDLHPAYADLQRLTASSGQFVHASGAPAPRSRLEALDWAMGNKPREVVYAEQDATAEAELAALEEHDRVAASAALTDDEYRALFGNS